MHEIWNKIKEFCNKHRCLIICFILAVCLYAFLSCAGSGENVSDNGNTADAVRGELTEAQGAEQHIADGIDAIESTVGGLTDTIENAANASSEFEAILDECADIIDAIRKQPTN